MQANRILAFLKELAIHNNREWFAEHRSEYEVACSDFEWILIQAIERISMFDDSVKGIQPKQCTYRIYRDVRFSLDKSPYKNHIGGYINAKGKKSSHGGYYIHLEPGNCFLAGGAYCLPPNILKAVRQSIYDNIDEYREIVEDPEFSSYFPVIGQEHLKTAPKGFPKEFPYIDYLKPKQYDVWYNVPDDFFYSEGWIDEAEKIFKQLKRFLDFTNETIDDYE